MEPQIFIGSSSESLDHAYAIQENLQSAGKVTVWDQGIFRLNNSTLDDLLLTLDKTDFAIFVFSPNDKLIMRDKESNAVRDNVLFEFGLFIGKLGKARSFFIAPRNSDNFHLPSDLLGIKAAAYDSGRDDLNAALGPACNEIRKMIRAAGVKNESRINIIQSQKDVYTYVFNRLNPYQDISLTHDFLRNLPSDKRFERIDDVLFPLDTLIHHYVPQFIAPWMRVYFAYKLEGPVTVSPDLHPGHTKPYDAYYRVGISYSKENDKWLEGVPIGIPSNVHLVYTRRSISYVRDATRSLNLKDAENEKVNDEASVIAFPVLYSDEENPYECIGVIGISSPHAEEVTSQEYVALTRELSTLFSALFYAYGKYLQRKIPFEKVISQLRSEIHEHFESINPLS